MYYLGVLAFSLCDISITVIWIRLTGLKLGEI